MAVEMRQLMSYYAGMSLSIGDLADQAGLSRRAVRFYVQRGLLPSPVGRGRGSRYDVSHLERIRRIVELQKAGHSLEAIARILDGSMVSEPSSAETLPAAPALSAELWTRLHIAEGVELHFDVARRNPTAAELLTLREAIRRVFVPDVPPSG